MVTGCKMYSNWARRTKTELPFNDLMRENKCLQSYLSRQILKTKLTGGGTVLLSEVRRSPKHWRLKSLKYFSQHWRISWLLSVKVSLFASAAVADTLTLLLGALFLPRLVLSRGCCLCNQPWGIQHTEKHDSSSKSSGRNTLLGL